MSYHTAYMLTLFLWFQRRKTNSSCKTTSSPTSTALKVIICHFYHSIVLSILPPQPTQHSVVSCTVHYSSSLSSSFLTFNRNVSCIVLKKPQRRSNCNNTEALTNRWRTIKNHIRITGWLTKHINDYICLKQYKSKASLAYGINLLLGRFFIWF